MDDSFSVLTPAGYSRSSCGYCGSCLTSQASTIPLPGSVSVPLTFLSDASVGFTSSSVLPSHYQALADRGWRRSGTYYYKPDNKYSCCPHYTIRLDATAFYPRKDQRKAINRWNCYVIGTEYKQKAARLCPKSRQEKRKYRNTFDLCTSVRASEYRSLQRPTDPKTKESIQPAHRFEVNLEPDCFTHEKYALFDNYQKSIHKDKRTSESGFKRFLCSGLGQRAIIEDGKQKLIGSYHQCYRLDGKLVAMGILDLLPKCVSSVYLIYHEDVIDWNFGKLSALRETAFALESNYQYYYMGYYIHSCTKMRYKGDYRPAYVLDPISHAWDKLDPDMFDRLSARRFVSMTLERQLDLPSSSKEVSELLETAPKDKPYFAEEIQIGNVKYRKALEYVQGRANRVGNETDEVAQSVFEAGTPGAMSLHELQHEIDLGQWQLTLGSRLVRLKDLVDWDESEISDPGSIEGIAAELAACIGPDLVRKTRLRFGG